jgi:hypothetical protein
MTLIDKACWERGCACYDSRFESSGEAVEVVVKTTHDHPLLVFAKECVLGCYSESEIGDAAERAIKASLNFNKGTK